MELKLETLQTASEYIVNLKEGVWQVISCYRDNQLIEGSALMTQVIEGLKWLIEVMTHTQDIFLNPVDITNTQRLLRDMIDALENQDSVLIADLFEYELIDLLESYEKEIIAALQYDRTLI